MEILIVILILVAVAGVVWNTRQPKPTGDIDTLQSSITSAPPDSSEHEREPENDDNVEYEYVFDDDVTDQTTISHETSSPTEEVYTYTDDGFQSETSEDEHYTYSDPEDGYSYGYLDNAYDESDSKTSVIDPDEGYSYEDEPQVVTRPTSSLIRVLWENFGQGKVHLRPSEYIELYDNIAAFVNIYDYPGALIVRNPNSGQVYVNTSNKVLEALYKYIRSLIKTGMLDESDQGFKTMILPLATSGYTSLKDLLKDLRKHYKIGSNTHVPIKRDTSLRLRQEHGAQTSVKYGYNIETANLYELWYSFIEGNVALDPESFEIVRKYTLKHKRRTPEFSGIYVLHNQTLGKAYVGQSVNVMDRIRQHMSGTGRGQTGSALLHADKELGHEFRITVIPLQFSNYSTLDKLESVAIAHYDSFYNGYNKTRGNHIND